MSDTRTGTTEATAQALVDAVTARLDTAHYEWEPGSVLAAAMLDALLDRPDVPILNRDFLQAVRQTVAATLPRH